MRNVKTVSRRSQDGRVPLYYSFDKDAVYTTAGEGRHFVTYLIRGNSESEIKEAIARWKNM